MVGADKPSCSDDLSNPEEEQQSLDEEEQCPTEEERQRSLKKKEQRLREVKQRLELQQLPKPSRSECALEYYVADPSCNECKEKICITDDFEDSSLPQQFQKFQKLLSKPIEHQETTTLGDSTVEYTVNDYYDTMNTVDKEHHHTTGTGFIKIIKPDQQADTAFHYMSHPGEIPHAPKCGISNPAMNDWVPQSEIKVPLSKKPSRSEPEEEFWN